MLTVPEANLHNADHVALWYEPVDPAVFRDASVVTHHEVAPLWHFVDPVIADSQAPLVAPVVLTRSGNQVKAVLKGRRGAGLPLVV